MGAPGVGRIPVEASDLREDPGGSTGSRGMS